MHNGWGPYQPFSSHTPSSPPHGLFSPPVGHYADNVDILDPPPAPLLGTIPLPTTSFDDVQLHQLLDYMTGPHIDYDVRHHPAYASALNAGQGWGQESATSPRASEMIVVCMDLPRPFVVRPSTKDHVTIRDILAATHDAFRETIQGDIAADGWVPGFSRQVEAPWSGHGTPLLMTPDSRPSASMGRYKWAGLSDKYEAGRWLLHVE